MFTPKSVKLELVADEKIFRILDGQSKICNWLYNCLLEHANRAKEEFCKTQNPELSKTVYSKRGLRNLIPDLKKECPFLKSVYSAPLKNAALRLSASIQAHQKGKKGQRKGKSGWPSFRSWQTRWFSLLYDEPQKGYKVTGNALTLSLGVDSKGKRLSVSLRLKGASCLQGLLIRNLRLTYTAGTYYAIFAVEVPLPAKKSIRRVIALDPNHKNFVYGVDTNGNAIEVASPRFCKLQSKRIDELKSQRDRCLKKSKKVVVNDINGQPLGKEYFIPSRRWKHFNSSLERALHQRQEQTKTYAYTLAHKLCRDYDCVGIGNYTPHGDQEFRTFNRAMFNNSLIGRFKIILSWVAAKSGKTYVEYDEKGTTRTCHNCGYIFESGLAPNIRKWRCPQCEIEHIRDENSAQNGLRLVLRDLSQKEGMDVPVVPGSGLVRVSERWAWRVLPSGVETLRGGKNSVQTQRQEIKTESMVAFDQKLVTCQL